VDQFIIIFSEILCLASFGYGIITSVYDTHTLLIVLRQYNFILRLRQLAALDEVTTVLLLCYDVLLLYAGEPYLISFRPLGLSLGKLGPVFPLLFKGP
jgi:hypothetical protein